MGNEIIRTEQNSQVPSREMLDYRKEMAKWFIDSHYFGNMNTGQAIVKMMVGEELGLAPLQAMTDVYVFQGKGQNVIIQVASRTIAAKINQHPNYSYKVLQHSPVICEIEFLKNGESIGVYKYTIEKAKQAGLAGKDNYRNHAEDMLYYRAISKGYKMYCPDVISFPVYVESEVEEMNLSEPAHIGNSSEIASPDILSQSKQHDAQEVAYTIEEKEPQKEELQEPIQEIQTSSLESVLDKIRARAISFNNNENADLEEYKKAAIHLSTLMDGNKATCQAFLKEVFNKESSKLLTFGECSALVEFIGIKQYDDGFFPQVSALDSADLFKEYIKEKEGMNNE